jgi:hypothetical protein
MLTEVLREFFASAMLSIHKGAAFHPTIAAFWPVECIVAINAVFP